MLPKKCAIMQPTYLPWIGYFDLIDQVDVFIFLDNVQLEKSSWQIRNRIKTHQGPLYLSLDRKRNQGGELPLIMDTEINEQQAWRKKHLKSIYNAYRKSAYFDEIFPFLEKRLAKPSCSIQYLASLNQSVIEAISDRIGIKTMFDKASGLDIKSTDKIKRLLAICQLTKSSIYLSPFGSRKYLNEGGAPCEFSKKDIQLYYHQYTSPSYPQLYPPFVSHLSIIDLLFNAGFDNALSIIRIGRTASIREINE